MNDTVKVSVIVPVYNAQKYLSKCLDSLLAQSLSDIEIICINDGSSDKSLEIIKKYKNEFEDKIVIIDKQNAGVWNARLDGIKIAKGKYVAFCDSDDYVDKDFIKKLYENIEKEKSDICVCGFERIDGKSEKAYSVEMIKQRNSIDIGKNPEELISINTALWNKLYRAQLLKNFNNIENPARILEDMMFLLLIYSNAKKISFLPEALYYYMVREGSAITTTSKKDIEITQNAMLEVKKVYSKYDAKMNEVLDCFAFLHFGISLMFRLSNNKEEKLGKLLKENRKFLSDNFSSYKKSKYLNISYVLKNKSSNLKVAIMKKVYLSIFFRAFLVVYNFMINKLKIDIKW